MNKKNKDKRQERMEDLLYVPQIVLAKYILDLEDTIDEAIEILEKDENKEPIEAILNNVGKALDILKGEL